ncbi:MAG: DUF3784 domain-containing protein [Bacteroidia bacterium]
MLVVAILLGLFFFGLSFILTKANAPTLLAGYNSLSAEEQAKFDLEGYIPFFKRFHWFLGVSTIILSLLGYYLIGEDSLGYIIGVFPILAYVYFILASQRFQQSQKQLNMSRIGAGVLLVVVLGVGMLMYFGQKPNVIKLTDQALVIEGMYGEAISWNAITNIEQLETLPDISMRLNGFSTGSDLKGYFRTESGEKVKLLVERDAKPLLRISSDSSPNIYLGQNDLDTKKNQKKANE